MTQRALDLKSLAEAEAEVDRLHANGYTKLGQWDLSQVCQHLGIALRGSVGGVMIPAPFYVKLVARLFMKKQFYRSRKIKPGLGAPAGTTFDPIPEAEAVRAFHHAVKHYNDHRSNLGEHPFFGPLNEQEWNDFHVIHASHHLSFLKPKE